MELNKERILRDVKSGYERICKETNVRMAEITKKMVRDSKAEKNEKLEELREIGEKQKEELKGIDMRKIRF